MRIIYTSETQCKIDDLLICIPTLEVEAHTISITQNTNWTKIFDQYKLPILHQKNYLEIAGKKVDIKKGAINLLGDSSYQSITVFLSNLASKSDIECLKICEYTFFDGLTLANKIAKTPMFLTSTITENPKRDKPIESVMKIKVGNRIIQWYECTGVEQINWYCEQKKTLEKLLNK